MKNKIDNFEIFESKMRIINNKDMNLWGKERKVNNKDSKWINELSKKGTPHLNWLRSKGYTVNVNEGSSRDHVLDHLGMDGYDYTFHLIPSWSKESFLDYLSDKCELSDKDIDTLMDKLGWDIDELEIYGMNKNRYYEFDGGFQLEEICDTILSDNFDDDIKYTIEGSDDIDLDDCPLWGAKVPISFSGISSREYDILCEYGLIMIKNQISKLIKVYDVNSYSDMIERFKHIDKTALCDDTDIIIKYLNYSNMNVNKNEDISWVRECGYNLYNASKLIYENHEERHFKISEYLVEEFLTETSK